MILPGYEYRVPCNAFFVAAFWLHAEWRIPSAPHPSRAPLLPPHRVHSMPTAPHFVCRARARRRAERYAPTPSQHIATDGATEPRDRRRRRNTATWYRRCRLLCCYKCTTCLRLAPAYYTIVVRSIGRSDMHHATPDVLVVLKTDA